MRKKAGQIVIPAQRHSAMRDGMNPDQRKASKAVDKSRAFLRLIKPVLLRVRNRVTKAANKAALALGVMTV